MKSDSRMEDPVAVHFKWDFWWIEKTIHGVSLLLDKTFHWVPYKLDKTEFLWSGERTVRHYLKHMRFLERKSTNGFPQTQAPTR
jgi:hypothetical protein